MIYDSKTNFWKPGESVRRCATSSPLKEDSLDNEEDRHE